MPYPTFTANEPILGWQLRALQETEVEQGTDLVVNNSVTLVDTNLVMRVKVNATYDYHLMVVYRATFVADIALDWSGVPVGGFMDRAAWGTGFDNTLGNVNSQTHGLFRYASDATDVVPGGVTAPLNGVYQEFGTVTGAGPVDVDVRLRFAQNTADPTDAMLLSFSRLRYIRTA